MKNRIQKILIEEGMTSAKFADEIGIQASGVSHFLSGRNKPSADILAKILDRFRGINAEWLLTGRGSMYKDSHNSNQLPEKSINNYSTKDNHDLFSAGLIQNSKPETGAKVEEIAENISLNEKESDNSDMFVDNSLSSVVTDQSLRKIEKIVIFFNDNSFEYYSPK